MFGNVLQSDLMHSDRGTCRKIELLAQDWRQDTIVGVN